MSRLTAQDLYFTTCARWAVNPKAAGSKGYRSGLRMIAGGESPGLERHHRVHSTQFAIAVLAAAAGLLWRWEVQVAYGP